MRGGGVFLKGEETFVIGRDLKLSFVDLSSSSSLAFFSVEKFDLDLIGDSVYSAGLGISSWLSWLSLSTGVFSTSWIFPTFMNEDSSFSANFPPSAH